MTPRATYRIQFHKDFTFADALGLVDYFADLGISHLYASPIATARAGSTHGYDVVDPTRINPELGGEEAFRTLAAALRERGLGIILDIVPNHMAVGGSDNDWWLDVLEKGAESPYARYFDIDWAPADPELDGKVLAPFLGGPYEEVLASGDLVLDYEPDKRRLSVLAYGTHRFPIRRDDYPALLAEAGAERLTEAVAEELKSLYDPLRDAGRERLHALLDRQLHRLAWWRVAGDEINWRRFFEITELAGLRVEDPAVFDAVHALPLRLYAEGLIDGVRVDHVDGLADPTDYCRRLRAALEIAAASRPVDAPAGPAYLVVEKILAEGERLPREWGTDGTSGYDYMNEAAALLHDPAGEAPLSAFWEELSGRPANFAVEEKAARLEILSRSFSGQLDAAVAAFHAVARSDVVTRDVSAGALRRGLTALLSVFPAYRTYGTGDGAVETDATIRASAAERAKVEIGTAEAPVIDLLVGWLAGEGPGDIALRREAVRRFQQLSAPVSAKAVEDTAFYRYGRLLSRTDVGFDPARFAATPEHFARAAVERLETFPHALLATATHDHKRGEDVRARLAVLSEVPERWIETARRWLARVPEGIDAGDCYQMFQTLVGAWPLGSAEADFADRVVAWQTKALREAKLRSSWTHPDEAYEQACEAFVRELLAGDFAAELRAFVGEIEAAGAVNGIVQAVLRCTVTGVPDCYQGTEHWDFSLVDPDNRRPVDFAARIATLAGDGRDWRSGALKQQAIAEALRLRREKPALFAEGRFERVAVTGARADHVFAFLRSHGSDRLLVAVPLRVGAVLHGADAPVFPAQYWSDTEVVVPGGEALPAAELFEAAPYALRWV
ncbi:malto-oligosyltrehalose synthase [Sphingosinicella sp. BN140058]|uniref:malto-oligosyltrehalose synthase n=1 Tax=Sphingosinicella sp. BN140058 TaxID=1892855 RepID=UPI00101239E8|nr:malto-oligosyltrehalose synthase [Sphingosinicella sp. BN140058]QAY77600.1 malto-oligosyltrehalose synthase [Sphingosinicella sp. BN140058]